MTVYRMVFAALAAFVLVAGAPTAQGAGGTPIVTCGQTVTTNAFLTQDLYCPGSHGVVVGASGITIDLKGSTLRGDGSHYGINNFPTAFDGVTVKNGVIVNFDTGILARNDANNVTVSKVVVSGNIDGIYITGDFAKIQSVTASGNQLGGVSVNGNMASIKSLNTSGNGSGLNVSGDSVSLKSVTASGNYYGVYFEGDAASIQAVTAAGNDTWGISVVGDAAALKGNIVNGNGSPDGVSNGDGLGLTVSGFTIPPVGTKNIALGNDDPTECVPSYIC